MDRELGKLLHALFKNPQDESVLEELGSRLVSSPDDCEYYLDYCRLHGDLQYLVMSESAERRVLDGLGAATIVPSSLAQARVQSATSVSRSRRWWGLMALAASVVILVGWQLLFRPLKYSDCLRQPTIAASIVSADEPVWKVTPYAVGQSIRVGTRLRLEQGLVKVNMPTGAELLLQGPCDVLLATPDQVVLSSGKVTAHVADWAHGFAVETASMRVVDLGTQFAVEVDADGTTEAHVLDGHVRVQPLVSSDQTRSSFLLGTGQAVRIDSAHDNAVRLVAQKDRFVTGYGEFRPYRLIEIFNTGNHLNIGDEDPHWRIVSGAIGEGFQGPQYAVVCEPDVRYLPNRPALSQWVSVAKDIRPGCLPNSSYTFRTEFDLSGYDVSTVMVLADILADNGVSGVRLNGRPVDLVPWRDNQFQQQFRYYRRAEFVAGFLPGKNVIEIDVWNGIYKFGPGDDSKPTPNPMAIRVEWQAFGVPASEHLEDAI